MNFKKNKLISIFLIIFSLVYKIKKQIAEKPIINNFQKTIIFETNLPDISNTFNNNFFIIADKFEHIYKNFVIKIMKDGVEIEIENENLKNLIISTNEDEVNYSNKLEYFVIRSVKLKDDSDIGIIHEHLNVDDFKNSSGYILNQRLVEKRKNICISTSSVYNNWVCFVYDNGENNFILSYAQNFAD